MHRITSNWALRTQRLLALCGTLALSACASKYAQVPPRLQLEPYGRVALVTFSGENARGTLNKRATQQFAEELLASQSGIEVLELDAADSALRGLSIDGDGAAFAQALGKKKDVAAVFVGHLRLSDVKPRGRLSSPTDVQVGATISAELTVRLLSTRTGGTVWRSSATSNGTVAKVSLAGGLPSVSVRNPEEAYSDVVTEAVTYVTRDLRPTWVKQ